MKTMTPETEKLRGEIREWLVFHYPRIGKEASAHDNATSSIIRVIGLLPKWVAVTEVPLFEDDGTGEWITTEAGSRDFVAAIPLAGGQWWVHYCRVKEDGTLAMVYDDGEEDSGYDLEDITLYLPIPILPALPQSPESPTSPKTETTDPNSEN